MGSTKEKDIKVEETLLDLQIMASNRMEDKIKENSISKEEETIDRVTEEGMIEMLLEEEMTEMETEGNSMNPKIKPPGDNKEATLGPIEEVVVSRIHRCLTWSKSI